jgi:hypothetical protein
MLLAFIGGLRDPVSSVCLPLHVESDAKIKLTVRPINGVIAQTHSYRCVEIIQALSRVKAFMKRNKSTESTKSISGYFDINIVPNPGYTRSKSEF